MTHQNYEIPRTYLRRPSPTGKSAELVATIRARAEGRVKYGSEFVSIIKIYLVECGFYYKSRLMLYSVF